MASSTKASSSSSSSSSQSGMYGGQWEYDVFLCFRGADTRRGFTSHLRAALFIEKVKAFIDDMLDKTESIDELTSVLQRSALSIVIFSENFADSSWCLDEVATISQSMEQFSHPVLPVFYEVDPADVSEGFGSYAAAIEQKHGAIAPKKRKREYGDSKSLEDRKRWMDALKAVANCAGYTSQAFKLDSELVEAIVKDVQNRLAEMSPRVQSDNLIGMDARISKVEELLAMNIDDFCLVELWGMGGVGKTTLAKACYQRLISLKKGIKYHFVRDINQRYENENGMEGIVTELYSTMLSESNISYDDLDASHRRIRLSRLRVFLVFDDVGTLSQLEQLLLGDISSCSNLFAPGSRIILTTRNRMVLEDIGARIYQVDCLDSDESLELFRIHAFGCRLPPNDLLELSRMAVSYCKGCPLAIKVFGGTLSGKGRDYWVSFLGAMRQIPTPGIHDVLKRSYDALGVAERRLFLDIACFFCYGTAKVVLITYSPARHLLQDLIDKSLCTCVVGDLYEQIEVHDLLSEMAWSIVNEESKLENRTRLENYDVHNLLTRSSSSEGGRATEGISLYLFEGDEMHLGANAFEGMTSLRFLRFFYRRDEYGGIKVRAPLHMLPDSLRWLMWHSFPSKSLPSRFRPDNLVLLSLRGSPMLKRCFEAQPKLVNLLRLDLSHCINLIAIPDLSRSPNLEDLILEGCKSLIELPSQVGDLDKLVRLNLHDCTNLRSLPTKFNSKFLTYVHMSNCPKLTRYPEISCGELKILDLMETPVEAPLPSAIHNVMSGGTLCLCGKHINSFPAISASLNFFRLCHTTIREMDCYDDDHYQQGSLPTFVQLKLVANPQLKSLSLNIWKMVSHTLVLKDCRSIETLPEISQPVNGLTVLSISGCRNLKSFPSGISNLKSLHVLHFIGTDIKSMPSCIEELHQLSYLDLCSNKSLEFIPSSIHKLAMLSYLFLSDCPRIQYLPELPPNLQTLILSGCSSLKALPSIPNHATSSLHPQPKLVNLVRLDLSNCINLAAIPDLSGSSNLEELSLQGCKSLIELPSYVGDLDKLISLDLSDCTNLRSLPARLNSKILTHVWLSNCPKLTRCPEINSGELKTLNIKETPVEAPLPSAIHNVKSGGLLHLCGKHITSFPTISASLDFFGLCHTTIRDMDCYDDDQQGSLPRFVRLELADNPQLKRLSRNIWKMVSDTLILEDCPIIETLPKFSKPVMDLTQLSITGCRNLKSFPYGIGNLKSLQHLCFIGTDIKSLPACIQELDQLSYLDLCSNKSLEFIPNSIHKLAKLSYLFLSDCSRIQFLPELPPNLLTLDLSGCTWLKALPSNIAMLGWEHLCFEDCPELDMKLPQEILRDFPNHAVSNPHPQGVLQCSGSEIPERLDYTHLVVRSPPNSTIKGIAFAVVCSCSSDIGIVDISITCECIIDGTTVAASWSSPGFGLGRTPSDNVYIWYDKNLLGETKQGRIREDADPWYERYRSWGIVSFNFFFQLKKGEDPEKLKSIKFKSTGVSLLY